jgi:methylamine dehydrogenase heavy chain
LLAWRPGGSKLATVHKASGRLFVLMHPGAHWTHKDDGKEVWVFDIAAKKRVARYALKAEAGSIAVTQDAEPLLFAVGGGPMGSLTVMNANTGETRGALPGVSGGILGVHGF